MNPARDEATATTVTLHDVVAVIGSTWRLWLGGAVLGCIIGATLAYVTEPTYRAAVTVMPVSESPDSGALGRLASQFGGLAGVASIGAMEDDGREEALAVIRSQAFTERMILEEDLLPMLFHKRWDPNAKTWSVEPGHVPSLWDGWNLFDKRIRTIIEDRERNLVTIRIEWRDREIAARWANAIVQRANRELRDRRLAEIDRSLQHLQGELVGAQFVELRQAIAKVMEAQVSSRMIASTRPEYAFRILDPARAPDADRPISPKKALWIVLGTVAGGLAGFGVGLIAIYSRRRRGIAT